MRVDERAPSIDSLFCSDANSINAGGNFSGCMTPNFSISLRRKTKQAHDGEVCVCSEQNRTFNLHMQYRVRKYLRCQPACSQRGARSIIFYSFSLSIPPPAPSTLFTLERTRCSRPCVEFIVKERVALYLGNIWQARRKKKSSSSKKKRKPWKERKSKF
jgi:hypothetical protein